MALSDKNLVSLTASEHIDPEETGDNISAKRVALYVWDPELGAAGEWIRYQPSSGGGSVTQGTDPWVVSDKAMATRIDEASETVTYIGSSLPGTATSETLWQIKKIDSSSGTAITYADGVSTFTKEWDERVNYNYS